MLVACSGGPDSLALVHVLARLADDFRISLRVASVDHGIRPEAAEEVARVGAFASSLGLPFSPVRVEVARGPSLQGCARRARYDALLALAREHEARVVAVGHTLDDQAETVIGRMIRGAGVGGLAGIAPARADGVVRPLIDCRRVDVEAHLSRHGLTPVRDPSNDDQGFERVRIRQHVLPLLVAEDPQLVAHLGELADDARALDGWIASEVDRLLAAQPRPVPVSVLRDAPRPLRRAALRRLALDTTGRDPGRAHLEAMDRALGGRGEVLLGQGWGARVEAGQWRIARSHRRTRSR